MSFNSYYGTHYNYINPNRINQYQVQDLDIDVYDHLFKLITQKITNIFKLLIIFISSNSKSLKFNFNKPFEYETEINKMEIYDSINYAEAFANKCFPTKSNTKFMKVVRTMSFRKKDHKWLENKDFSRNLTKRELVKSIYTLSSLLISKKVHELLKNKHLKTSI